MGKISVLVVEDESIVSKDIQYSLKKLGYNVVGVAATGQKAIELCGEKLPDIILMDIMLKGDINGIEASTRIKESYNIPVIFFFVYCVFKAIRIYIPGFNTNTKWNYVN